MEATKAPVEYANSMDQITSLVKAHVPYIWVVTHEEKRFLEAFHLEVADKHQLDLWTWSSHLGIIRYTDDDDIIKRASGDWDKTWMPNIALDKIVQYKRPSDKKGSIFVMKDFHTVLQQPIPRQMRDVYQALIGVQKTMVILSPCIAHGPSGNKPGMEPTLDKQMTVVDYELPNRDYIRDRIKDTITVIKENNKAKKIKSKLDYTDDEYNTFATALQGLTEIEVDNALFTCITHLKRVDERRLLLEKKQIVKKSEILEYIGHAPSMDEVGGLDEAKKYFEMYSDQFTPEAREFGVEPLRGVLLTGVPGTGKSLLAKAISAQWNLPLLRLDVGKVMTGLVGGSEEKMRQVIGQAEAIAPCVLWIDEIEKSLSGTKSSNFSDGGTLARVFGTLLTAMEERFDGVVTIATANDIQALPPELVRRFNEVLFVDLPVPTEREEIFRIHLNKRKRDLDKLGLNIQEMIAATHKFTGSEIEKAVKESITRAWRDGKREVETKDVLGAVSDTKAIAIVMGEKISQIRDWARDRARYASSLAAKASAPGAQKVTTSRGKELDLSEDLDDLDEIVKTPKEEDVEEHQKNKKARAHNLLDD